MCYIGGTEISTSVSLLAMALGCSPLCAETGMCSWLSVLLPCLGWLPHLLPIAIATGFFSPLPCWLFLLVLLLTQKKKNRDCLRLIHKIFGGKGQMTFSWVGHVTGPGHTFTFFLERGHLPMLSLQWFLSPKLRAGKKDTQTHRERWSFCRKKVAGFEVRRLMFSLLKWGGQIDFKEGYNEFWGTLPNDEITHIFWNYIIICIWRRMVKPLLSVWEGPWHSMNAA